MSSQKCDFFTDPESFQDMQAPPVYIMANRGNLVLAMALGYAYDRIAETSRSHPLKWLSRKNRPRAFCPIKRKRRANMFLISNTRTGPVLDEKSKYKTRFTISWVSIWPHPGDDFLQNLLEEIRIFLSQMHNPFQAQLKIRGLSSWDTGTSYRDMRRSRCCATFLIYENTDEHHEAIILTVLRTMPIKI